MTFKLPAKLDGLSAEKLASLITEAKDEFDALKAKKDVTAADAARATELRAAAKTLGEQITVVNQAAADLRSAFDDDGSFDAPAAPEVVDPAAGDGGTPVAAAEVVVPDNAAEITGELVTASVEPFDFKAMFEEMAKANAGMFAELAKTMNPVAPAAVEPGSIPSAVVAAARATEQPRAKNPNGIAVIVASADVPDIATGSELDGIRGMGTAVINRMRGFSVPSGDGETENLQKYGTALIRKDFSDLALVADGRNGSDQEVLQYAARESRLAGNSLVAAGGWCAPSETVYDLCETETLDGILSVPEILAKRGGLNTTLGPDFSTIYGAVGFTQTEAQAIAGTTKSCYEVTCPTFSDKRLDVVGLCIKAPILTNAAFPEIVDRILRGSLIAHAHKVNNKVLADMATLLGTALVMNDLGASTQSTLSSLEYIIDQERSKYRMGLNQTMEVVAPHWLRGVIRGDLAARNGVDMVSVSDAEINGLFAARKANIQWVYDWQDLSTVATQNGYPANVQLMVYPAGAFVKATKDVIRLDSVYDAASLSTNVYTALFFEEGLKMIRTCFGGRLIQVPVCESGRTGIASLTACNVNTGA